MDFDFLQGNTGITIGIVVVALLLIVGLINYIKVFKEVSEGKTPVKKSTSTTPPEPTPPPPPTRPKGPQVKQLLPPWLKTLGLVCFLAPFAEVLLDNVFGIAVFDFRFMQDAFGSSYEFMLGMFLVSTVIACVLLFVAFCRNQKQKKGWGFLKSTFIFALTYGFGIRFVGTICLHMGEAIFNAPESSLMLFNFIAYTYLLIWARKYKKKYL